MLSPAGAVTWEWCPPFLPEIYAHRLPGLRWDVGGDGGNEQLGLPSSSPPSLGGGCPIQQGLTCASLQGAYGVVRLAYNESEDRHYVSLGKGGRCRLHWALEDWGVGRSCAKTVDKAACEGNNLPVLSGMQRE